MRLIQPFYMLVLLSAMLFLGASLGSCDSEDPVTYDVTVAWNIGGVPSCQSPTLTPEMGGGQLTFDDIQVRVYKNKGDATPLRDVLVPCIDNSYVVADLDEGAYYVRLDAYSTYQDVHLPYFQSAQIVDAKISDGSTVQFPLSIGTGTVIAKWEFAQGLCGANGVSYVNISLLGGTSATTAPIRVPCDQGFYEFAEVQWDQYNLSLEGFDAKNVLTHVGQSAQFLVRPGAVIGSEDYIILNPN